MTRASCSKYIKSRLMQNEKKNKGVVFCKMSTRTWRHLVDNSVRYISSKKIWQKHLWDEYFVAKKKKKRWCRKKSVCRVFHFTNYLMSMCLLFILHMLTFNKNIFTMRCCCQNHFFATFTSSCRSSSPFSKCYENRSLRDVVKTMWVAVKW